MYEIRRFLLVLLGVVWLGALSSVSALQVGTAKIRITPPIGIPMAGYYHERGATGVHDDLFARAIVLEEGGQKVALVSLDLITTRRHHVVAARKAIEARCDIGGDRVMISATHAHTGPILSTLSSRRIGQAGANPMVEAYSESLPDWIADAESVQALREGELRVEFLDYDWKLNSLH